MRTLISRSTMTSYFRSEVDHLVVNTSPAPPYALPYGLQTPYIKRNEMSIFTWPIVSCLDTLDCRVLVSLALVRKVFVRE